MPLFTANDFSVCDDSDFTKILKLNVSALPTATLATLTLPYSGSGTMVIAEHGNVWTVRQTFPAGSSTNFSNANGGLILHRSLAGTTNYALRWEDHVGSGSTIIDYTGAFLSSSLRVVASEGSANYFTLNVSALTTARDLTIPDANLVVAGSAAALTSGRVPYATTGGILTDDADLTFDTQTLTVTKLAVGTTTAVTGLPRSLFDNYADVSVGGAETDIYSVTTAASTFDANGAKVLANYGGNFVTIGTESVQLQVKFAGTTIWDSTGIAVSTGTSSWRVYAELIRVSATVVRYSVSLNTTGASGFVYCTVGELTGLTLSNTNILKITGTSSGVGSGVGDIVGKMSSVRYQPAA